jgi:hypothetical protein
MKSGVIPFLTFGDSIVPMKIYVEPERNFTEEIKYVWKILACHYKKKIDFVDDPAQGDILFDTSNASSLPISVSFYTAIHKGVYPHPNFFKDDCFVHDEQGRIDYVASIFYLINSIQEYGATSLDAIGRFRYEDSYQKKFGCVTKNLVQECSEKLIHEYRLDDFKTPKRKTRFFLSHDIDSIHGALLQDGLFLARRLRFLPMFQVMIRTVLGRPDWFNMDKIMDLEDEYSFKSTFFWLANMGRINDEEVNADYDIALGNVQAMIGQVGNRGWENGIHKSISPDSILQEIDNAMFTPVGNRHHYLKFTLPKLYQDLEASGLRMDASLGFAEELGFRNSYGLPFKPFDISNRKMYSFLEIPLHVMDGTLQKYKRIPLKETGDCIIRFIEENKEDCILSLLWHNTLFTDYKYAGYILEYRKVLAYLYENKFECMSASEIINEYACPA